MSVMQVVGSSRINNTVYLAVASIIWTAILTYSGQLIGFSIETAVQTTLLIVPIASVIGVVLWALRIESWVIQKVILFFIPRFTRGKAARFNMATATLLVKPWQVSPIKPSRIPQTLQKESLRAIQSLNLHKDMEELYNLFWVVVITYPLVYLFGSVNQLVQNWQFILVLLFIGIIAIPVLYRRRKRMKHVTDLALCQWLNELITTDIRLRKNRRTFGRSYNLYTPNNELLTKLVAWATELINLTGKEDWDGFEDNVVNMKSFFQSEALHFFAQPEHLISVFDDYILDVLHLVVVSRDELKPTPEYLFDTENIAKTSIDSALIQLEFFPKVQTKTPEIRYDHRKEHTLMYNLLREVDNFLKDWERIYKYFTRNTIGILSQNTLKELHQLPYSIHPDKPIPQLDHSSKTEDRIRFLIRRLIDAANNGLIEIRTILKSIQNWGFNTLDSYFRDLYLKEDLHLFVEEDFGQSAKDLAPFLRRIVDSGPIDENKVVSLMSEKRNDPNFPSLKTAIKNLSVKYHDSERGKIYSRILTKIT